MNFLETIGIIKLNVNRRRIFYMKRRIAREKAMQVLFQLDNTSLSVEEAIEHVIEKEKDEFFDKLVYGVTTNLEEIDNHLEEKLENWSLNRLPKIERTILRLAVYELNYLKDAPPNVVLNEAIELSKTFGDEKSSKFVNGVLSKFI